MFRRFKAKPKHIDMTQFTPLPEGGYLVGGAVRDTLLNCSFKDIDWLVNDPQQAAKNAAAQLGGSLFALDEHRGHWRVVAGETVRDYIRLEGRLEANLRERDFTINAMAASLNGALIDPTSGLEDLRSKQIKMVSEPNIFGDPLRTLRGVRIANELGFNLEKNTLATFQNCAKKQLEGSLPLSAWERVREELDALILSDNAGRGFARLASLGLTNVYLPEVTHMKGVAQGGFHHLDVLEHSLEALNQLVQGFPEADLALRWATLFHDTGKPDTKTYDESGRYYHFYGHDKLGAELVATALGRLRQPEKLCKRAAQLVRYHMVQLPKTEKSARRFVHRRRDILPDLLKLMIADREAARGPLSSEGSRQQYRLALGRVLEIMAATPPKPPLLSGREIMAFLALEQGPQVGKAVRFLKEAEAVRDVTTVAEAKAALQTYARGQGW